MTIKVLPSSLAGALAIGFLGYFALGEAPSPVRDAPPAPAGSELNPEAREAVGRGLKWLAAQQQDDGAFAGTHWRKHVGITALACLAFMCDGSMPGRGPYGDVVEEGLSFVLSASDPASGFISADPSHGPMYGHGFATLFLAEAYGMTESPRIEETLRKAVRLIVNSQNKEGGWRYHPRPIEADVSVTICQVMALRAARNAGISASRKTIDNAIQYVKNAQNKDGGFRYRLNAGRESGFPRSAAGVATLYYAGIYEGQEIDKGLDYLMQFLPSKGNRVDNSYYHYGHYYAVQAMFLAGGEHWDAWWPAIRDELIRKQNQDGSWFGRVGEEYGTAMSLIILQMPNRVLPIFQR
jgi:hypothetical protein